MNTAIRAGIVGFGLSGRAFHLPLLSAAGIAVASALLAWLVVLIGRHVQLVVKN